ncbi:hypothetical protein NEMIN01_1967 [Nematocida minor]|uniref:uncharacterized protein n=1 Tax=Nematocida minor TaxID=1912983 RepID=UPI00221F353F|nr:uncharacterized protein NEMIN01_1967 [Nematocida minor]KAI5192353.1 hypothetical protein NEMIN01_1967 [Nematocida minor]
MQQNNENPFKIDSRQQKKYEAKKRAEEIKELESKYKDELSQEETEDDASYEESEEENVAVQKLIEKIRNKEPEIYDKERQIFEEIKQSHKTAGTAQIKEREKERSYRLKDYYRDAVLDKMEENENTEEESREEKEETTREGDRKKERVKKRVQYDTEQKQNIDAFIAAMDEVEVDDELFQKKPKEEGGEEDTDEFLTEYVLKGGWQKELEKKEKEDTELFLEEDSEEIEMIEEFDKEGMPATGGKYSTVKKPTQQRKRKELRKKMRNREEEKIKQEEIKRLKNLKKQQFADRLSILRSVSGLSKRKVSKIRLEDSYDRRELDKILEDLFGEEYFSEKEEKRPKIKGSEMEAQELKQLEQLAEKGELQHDRETVKEIKKILSEIREIGEEYGSLKKQGTFEYVKVPTVDLGLSVKDILLADDKTLKRQYPLKKFAPFQDEDEKRKMERSLKRRRMETER